MMASRLHCCVLLRCVIGHIGHVHDRFFSILARFITVTDGYAMEHLHLAKLLRALMRPNNN